MKSSIMIGLLVVLGVLVGGLLFSFLGSSTYGAPGAIVIIALGTVILVFFISLIEKVDAERSSRLESRRHSDQTTRDSLFAQKRSLN